ncbi:acyltransferase PGAP2-like [Tubulanus polymorphus]|uniref:acyltransferase PGAP2-like n=1 Tax=Tubulanus polymorphus TaxID=672921 RepID=UPI003DA3F71C
MTMETRNGYLLRQRTQQDHDENGKNCCNCQKRVVQQQQETVEPHPTTLNPQQQTSLKVDSLHLRVSFRFFAIATTCLPLLSMFFCFVTSMIFQFDQVNHTFCKVQNFIPSISAITGIAPQRYVWRVCIGLHSTPRFLVAFMYWNYFLTQMRHVAPEHRSIFKVLLRITFWLNVTENACLIGVTYVSNVENYPLHEKIFIVFMVASIAYMILHSYLFKWSYGPDPTPTQLKSLKLKLYMLTLVCISTAGLLYFFYKHRVYCEPGAFSWFSFSEYGIAAFSISYHFTGYLEFSGSSFLLGTVAPSAPVSPAAVDTKARCAEKKL